MDTERKNLGWGNDLARPYTCSASDQEVQKQLSNLDVLIAGSFPERQTKEYGKKAKLFFRYSERILKTGNPLLKYPKRFFHWHACNPPWRKAYMLCASAYTAGDYAKFCGEKYTCALAYRKKLSYIRNLFKNEDYVELEKAFAGYTRMNDRCLKNEEAFETDPEVFDLYLKYLEKTGRISYMEKVKKYV